jgi:hypothetical protein
MIPARSLIYLSKKFVSDGPVGIKVEFVPPTGFGTYDTLSTIESSCSSFFQRHQFWGADGLDRAEYKSEPETPVIESQPFLSYSRAASGNRSIIVFDRSQEGSPHSEIRKASGRGRLRRETSGHD